MLPLMKGNDKQSEEINRRTVLTWTDFKKLKHIPKHRVITNLKRKVLKQLYTSSYNLWNIDDGI